MAKRQTKRLVVIHFRGRSPDDPRELLHAVEEVFKPGEIHVDVEPDDQDAPERPSVVPDDETAQKAKDRAADLLDLKDREIREMEADLAELKVEPKSWAKREKEKRSALADWLKEKVKKGWRFTAKVVVPAAVKAIVESTIKKSAG